ncbi:efflux RND transporter periplasmic adaptor subunit [Agitococcus lubricus]|uniref:HlyD family secretion protein n=1 Tax=Agitococcus lubricus TaxID=1077255 RepID=A0A2T5IWY0_9GAMM|nr:efflux RND transporter periplasmic adaptor subunit [Agitococcus lubricus]PTQ88425.1 HlyD family secretion protein [Agitococcus lubricus]
MLKKILFALSFVLALILSNYWVTHLPIKVNTIKPQTGSLQVTILATGQVQSPSASLINHEIAGVVVAIANEGQAVKKGALLARTEDPENSALLAQATQAESQALLRLNRLKRIERKQSQHNADKATLLWQQAVRQHQDNLALANTGQISPEQLRLSAENMALKEQDVKIATLQQQALLTNGIDEKLAFSQWQQAQAHVAQLQAKIDKQTSIAPFDAIVLERNVSVGQYIKQGDNLLKIVPVGQQQIIARLDERWLSELHLQQEATVVADAYPEQKFIAYITYIAPQISDTRGTVEVRLTSKQWPEFLREGMTVSLELSTQKINQAVIIDSKAIQQTGNQYWVWVVDQQKAKKQTIRLGERSGNQVQVLSGLRVDAQVIITDQLLTDSQRVTVAASAE